MKLFNILFALLAFAVASVSASALPLVDTRTSLNPSSNIFPRDTDATLLGINCRGSAMCSSCSDIGYIHGLVQQISDDSTYGNNQQIACSGCKGAQMPYSLCIYPQYLGDRRISGKLVKEKLDALIAHGCGVCGSIPTEDNVKGNDIKNGELTVNYTMHGCNEAHKDKVC